MTRMPRTAAPFTDAEFSAAMAPFAPFEARPALAVAVSGGRDSMALTLLVAGWAAACGGSLVALTVDHGLRPESAREARQVGDWLAARGIAHRVLRWPGPYPQSGVQAAARAARYRLLEDYCAAHGILHLLLGHQREDQLETIRMRRARNSGSDGLAGMTALRELAQVRLLRPLLAIPRACLTATLDRFGQDWIDDPSNENPAYERARLRTTPAPGAAPLPESAAAIRCAAEAAATRALARCVALFPTGYARLETAPFTALPGSLRRAVLARCVTSVGGKDYAPRGSRLDRLVGDLATGRLGRGRTLGGCRIVPAPGAGGAAWLVVREAGAAPAVLAPGDSLHWDGRFRISAEAFAPTGLTIEGGAGACDRTRVPAPARAGLPAIRLAHGTPSAQPGGAQPDPVLLRFAPQRPLTDGGFVAPAALLPNAASVARRCTIV